MEWLTCPLRKKKYTRMSSWENQHSSWIRTTSIPGTLVVSWDINIAYKRFMRQLSFGVQQERLRESRDYYTEEDIRMNHIRLLHHLPLHAPQPRQWLQQTWLIQSQYFNLKSLSNKDSLVYYQTFSETVVLNNICTDGMQCPKLLHQRCRYLIIYFPKMPIRFGEIE